MDAAVELRGVREERDAARGELELERAGAAVEVRGVFDEHALVRGELESVRNELAVVVAERGEARKEAAYWSMRVDKFVEGRKICDKEMEQLLVEGFDLRAEIERLKSGKVLKGKDKGTRMPAVPPPPELVEVGVQVAVPGVSTVGVQTDVSRVQVVRETTYASVASQACPEVAPMGVGWMWRWGGWVGVLRGRHLSLLCQWFLSCLCLGLSGRRLCGLWGGLSSRHGGPVCGCEEVEGG